MDEIIAHTSQIPHCYEFIFFSLFYPYMQVHVGNSLLPPRTWIFLSEPLALWDNSQVREWPSAILQSVCRIFTVNALSDKMQVLGGSLGNRGRQTTENNLLFLPKSVLSQRWMQWHWVAQFFSEYSHFLFCHPILTACLPSHLLGFPGRISVF